MIKKIFKQDSFMAGLIMGIIVPWIMLAVIYGLDKLFLFILNMPILITSSTMQLIAIAADVLVMRYFMVKAKYEKTGKGFLVITFIYIIAFFANEYILKW